MAKKITKGLTLGGALLLAAVLIAPAAGAAKTAETAAALVSKGSRELESRRFTAAIESFAKAAKKGGGSAAYFLLGYAHYERGFVGGRPQSADRQDALETVKAYKTALTLDPALASVRQPDQLYFTMALSYEALDEFDHAMEAYKRAFTAAPDKPMIPLHAARLRVKLNDHSKAATNLAISLRVARSQGQEAALLKVIDSNPLFSELRALRPRTQAPAQMVAAAGRGEVLRDSVKNTLPAPQTAAKPSQPALDMLKTAEGEFKFRRYREAISAYNDALTINAAADALSQAELALIQERIGTSYARLGQAAEAIRALERSLQHMPANASAYYQLALAHAVSGSYSSSVHALNSALRAAHSGGELRKYMLLAKTDTELEPVRDLPGFKAVLADAGDRVARR